MARSVLAAMMAIVLSAIPTLAQEPPPGWQFVDENFWRKAYISDDWDCSRPIDALVVLKTPHLMTLPVVRAGNAITRLRNGLTLNNLTTYVQGCWPPAIFVHYQLDGEEIAFHKMFDGGGIGVEFDRTADFDVSSLGPVPDDPLVQLALFDADNTIRSRLTDEQRQQRQQWVDDAARRGSPEALRENATDLYWMANGTVEAGRHARPFLIAATDAGDVMAAQLLGETIDIEIGEAMRTGGAYDRDEALLMFRAYVVAASGRHWKALAYLRQYGELGFELGAEGLIDREEPNSIEIQAALNRHYLGGCDLTGVLKDALGPLGLLAGNMRVEDDWCVVGSLFGAETGTRFGRVSGDACVKTGDGVFDCSFQVVMACYLRGPFPENFAGFGVIGGTASCPPPYGTPMPLQATLRESPAGFEWIGR